MNYSRTLLLIALFFTTGIVFAKDIITIRSLTDNIVGAIIRTDTEDRRFNEIHDISENIALLPVNTQKYLLTALRKIALKANVNKYREDALDLLLNVVPNRMSVEAHETWTRIVNKIN